MQGYMKRFLQTVVLAYLLSFIGMNICVLIYEWHHSDDIEYISTYDAYIVEEEGIELVDGIYTTTSEDPQFIFENIDKKISEIEIIFSEPLTEEMEIEIYSISFGSYYATDSMKAELEVGTESISFEIDGIKSAKWRIDIGKEEGLTYGIEDIVMKGTETLDSMVVQVLLFVLLFILLWIGKVDRVFIGKIRKAVFLGATLCAFYQLLAYAYSLLILLLIVAFVRLEAQFLFSKGAKEEHPNE